MPERPANQSGRVLSFLVQDSIYDGSDAPWKHMIVDVAARPAVHGDTNSAPRENPRGALAIMNDH